MHQLTSYLQTLRISAGKPTMRQLARSTGYGKTTIGDALTGRAVPTWHVTKALIKALGGDEARAQAEWIIAKGTDTTTEQVPDWLISVHEPVPIFPTGGGLVEACVLARDDPQAAIGDGWEVIRVSALQFSARHYKDVPGSWSSNVVETLRRACEDGHLPFWVPEQATLLHAVYVRSLIADPGEVSALAAVQYACLAYRLAWLVWETTHLPGEELRHDIQSDMKALEETTQKDSIAVRGERTPAIRLLADAERIAQSITDENVKPRALSYVVAALAAIDPDRAERIAASITTAPISKSIALSRVAMALADTDLDRALRIAQSGPREKDRAGVLAGIAGTLADTDPNRALRIAQSITDDQYRVGVLCRIASAVAVTDPDRSVRLFADAERITVSITNALERSLAFCSLVRELATTDPDRAVRITQSITDGAERAQALANIAAGLAATDPDRAERIAESITEKLWKEWALSYVVTALATTDPDRAVRITQSITDGAERAQALANIAAGLATTDPDRAERIAQSITHNGPKVDALNEIGRALAMTDSDRSDRLFADAERIARCITDEDMKVQTLIKVAVALAVTDLDGAERIARSMTTKFCVVWALLAIAEAGQPKGITQFVWLLA